ncbi:hypothetical protein DL766_007801 [Monosporascus sp. MC13-8B]|uniref:Gram-positive cocci surface proteins LPxTG domain-containing protein n=1 Tax=Monosporascus cannonballus TaxID=155416 RepID=A0ABY0HCA3_9PEZI|nr:hypothetical protein DL763_008924 [Monosporascus cannonballus]RYO88211.1 hypothetical protein DL762_003816 [Monosporascus cannonballus]RYP22047.1 hypothetical protein DL766_007801 [Monosporascus sp. MC13-8B]
MHLPPLTLREQQEGEEGETVVKTTSAVGAPVPESTDITSALTPSADLIGILVFLALLLLGTVTAFLLIRRHFRRKRAAAASLPDKGTTTIAA